MIKVSFTINFRTQQMLEHEEELENIKERNQRIAQIEVYFLQSF